MELHRYYSVYVSIYLTLTCIKSSEPESQSSLRWGDEKQIRMETIKKTVVEQLGIKRPPISGMNISESEEEKMYQLYLQRVSQFDQNVSLADKKLLRISSVNMFVQKGLEQNTREIPRTPKTTSMKGKIWNSFGKHQWNNK
ncbi:uncharacterized protein LOC144497392 isoform X2 [Mustelus asterias]